MSEITYYWVGGKEAVEVSKDVQLPQFKVVGYKLDDRVFHLTTGKHSDIAW